MLKKIALRFAIVTHAELIALGFNDEKLYYRLADLNIYVEKRNFFYYTPDGKKHQLRNMLQVSDLIYGKTEYLHV